jgi:nucleoside-diphosphate-sugar epimerase
MIACANHEKRFGFETYNVATEINLTNNEILAGLREYFPEMEVNNAPERKGDVKHTLADVCKIANDVGFAASVEFWDGLRSTLKWWGLLDDE